MVHEVEIWVRRLRRRLSRSEWLIRLLGLSRSRDTACEPGLVLIQIDGLARPQLEKAMAQGRLPFLQRLLKDQRYHLHSLYSGVPSTTPAVTAELLYGVKAAVPAFSFFDRSTRRVFRMFEPQAAKELEQRLRLQGEPLLAGGSAYAGIYTGGADESHFCAASLGLSDLLQAKHPFILLLIFVLNVYSLLRTLALLTTEFVLAFVDCGRGLFDGRDLWKEIKFIPSRVGTCILMRELAVIGAKMDAARGLPVIFLDLIGYDEQSHRRGPGSRFARWSLKGIDDAVARIWKAARRSACRDYDVWIFSDHGNEETLSYTRERKRTVREAVAEVLSRNFRIPCDGDNERGVQSKRGRTYLRWRRHESEPDAVDSSETPTSGEPEAPIVTAMGPVGHVYLHEELTPEDRDRLGQALVDQARIPMVLVADRPNQAQAWTAAGRFALPQDVASILGDKHPFAEEVADDLVTLCHNPNAGDFVISGWNLSDRPYTFAVENGSHGGPGPHETHAFALIPDDVSLLPKDKEYMRPTSLRQGALHHLGRDRDTPAVEIGSQPSGRALRVMTYNVHSCVGLDGKLSPRRIARVIGRHEPDVVALQEVDVGRLRTDGAHQAEIIAEYLNMEYHFHPAMRVEEELYGDCVLSRLPMQLGGVGVLPSLPTSRRLEPRGALWVTLECDGTEVRLLNTHLGLKTREKLIQIRALLGPDWLGGNEIAEPIIFCGDLNATPRSTVWRLCREHFRDVQSDGTSAAPRATWFGHYPIVCIDHIFVSSGIGITSVEVGDDYLARIASDHRPLVADLRISS